VNSTAESNVVARNPRLAACELLLASAHFCTGK
jgi:hypothetical protein